MNPASFLKGETLIEVVEITHDGCPTWPEPAVGDYCTPSVVTAGVTDGRAHCPAEGSAHGLHTIARTLPALANYANHHKVHTCRHQITPATRSVG